jgi:CHASE3 domain sensor protein
MKLSDIKISTQLKISFGIILFLIAVLGFVAREHTIQLGNQTKLLYNHPFETRTALGYLTSDILSIRIEYRNFLLFRTPEDTLNAVTSIAVLSSDAEKQFARLEISYLGAKEDLENAKSAYEFWLSMNR